MSGYPTQAQFTEELGTVFVARQAGMRDDSAPGVELVLDAVRAGIESEGYAPFSLEFLGEGELVQATYALGHGLLGIYEVFLVPIASEGTATRYEAVFNVAKESEG